jgi:hypothetical protein
MTHSHECRKEGLTRPLVSASTPALGKVRGAGNHGSFCLNEDLGNGRESIGRNLGVPTASIPPEEADPPS